MKTCLTSIRKVQKCYSPIFVLFLSSDGMILLSASMTQIIDLLNNGTFRLPTEEPITVYFISQATLKNPQNPGLEWNNLMQGTRT